MTTFTDDELRLIESQFAKVGTPIADSISEKACRMREPVKMERGNCRKWERDNNVDGYIFHFKRIALFRPDVHMHSMRRIEVGNKYILSIGWVL